MEAQTPTPRKKKPNSPKAPGTSLRIAVAETAKLYQRYSHGTFSRGEMASALNMSGSSGAFMGKSATLREYDLISGTDGQIRVSDPFMAIYQAPQGSAELKRHALQAIKTPSVFARLLHQFPSKIPDETALALRLETQERFNRDRAIMVASAFRNSLGEYGLIDSQGNVLPVRDDAAVPSGALFEEAELDEIETPAGPGLFRVEVPLAGGRKAILALPDDLSAPDTTKICVVLAAYTTEAA